MLLRRWQAIDERSLGLGKHVAKPSQRKIGLGLGGTGLEHPVIQRFRLLYNRAKQGRLTYPRLAQDPATTKLLVSRDKKLP
jgi:hypothetical protein